MGLIQLIFSVILSSQAVIFGEDNRYDVVGDVASEQLSRSIAMSISPVFLIPHEGQFSLDFILAGSSDGFGLCPEEKFQEQPAGYVNCTGFLVADDILITAGHCMTFHQEILSQVAPPFCTGFQWLFDFKKEKTGSIMLDAVVPERIFNCKEILYAEHVSGIIGQDDGSILFPDKGEAGNDFAIIRLDRKVEGRKPLAISHHKIVKNDSVTAIGYPTSLPAKVIKNAKVMEDQFQNYFTTDLDILGGTSGGPVFNESQEVVGIVVRSFPDADYIYQEDRKCMKAHVCETFGGNDCAPTNPNEWPGSHVNRLDKAIEILKSYGYQL